MAAASIRIAIQAAPAFVDLTCEPRRLRGWRLPGFAAVCIALPAAALAQKPARPPSGMPLPAAAAPGANQPNGYRWIQMRVTPSPSPRWGHGMVYDPVRQRIVLFGGENGQNQLADTWEWDGARWHQVPTPVSPSARQNPLMAYDPSRQRVVLYGGIAGRFTPGGRITPLNDTWEWDGRCWTERWPVLPPTPVWRTDFLAYRPDTRSMMLVLSNNSTPYDPRGRMSEVWEFDGTSWWQRDIRIESAVDQNVVPVRVLAPDREPRPRDDPAIAVHPRTGHVLLMSGRTTELSAPNMADLWRWDWRSWQRLSLGPPPAQRYAHTLVFDDNDRAIAFGGAGRGQDGYFSDTWEWDGSRWAQVAPGDAPPPRGDHTMVFDAARGNFVMFGGYRIPDGALGDTWVLARESAAPAAAVAAVPAAPTDASCPVPAPPPTPNTTWVRAATAAASPPARAAHAMVYDAARQRVVLFGGQWDSTFGDTWEWDGTRWRQIRPVTSPPPRSLHGMAYDAARRRVVLFGGTGSYGAGQLRDTWEYDGSAWVQRQPAVSPGGQYFKVRHMWYDSVAGRVRLLWGSRDVEELWEWDGENWRRVTVAAPAGTDPMVFLTARDRFGMAYAFDTRRGRLHMHGGRISFLRYLPDLWEFDGSAWRAISPGSDAPILGNHAMAFDPDRGVMVLFGGAAPLDREGQPSNETWEWNGSRWVRVRPRVSPPAAEYPALVYDAARREMVMFRRDTWVYRRTGP